jgi:hypothetical protein
MWTENKTWGAYRWRRFHYHTLAHDVKFEPTVVCPFSVYFAEAMNMPITALEHGQFLIQKDEGAGFCFSDPTGLYGDLSLNKFPPSVHVKNL